MKKKLIAFHGDPLIREKYTNRVRLHMEADQIDKGYYWENGKGCAVGCTIHSGNHSAYETELGIPRQLARIEDSIFESLPNDLAKEWPLRFLEAIPVGADLYPAYWRFMHWLLVDESDGVSRFAKTDRTRNSIQAVAALYNRLVHDGAVKESERDDAAALADDAYAAADDDADAAAAAAAAAYAAYAAGADDAAAGAYAAYAADAAAYAAGADDAAAADDAAYAAAAAAYAAGADDAAADDAADDAAAALRSKARIQQSDKLLEFLAKAPVLEG